MIRLNCVWNDVTTIYIYIYYHENIRCISPSLTFLIELIAFTWNLRDLGLNTHRRIELFMIYVRDVRIIDEI